MRQSPLARMDLAASDAEAESILAATSPSCRWPPDGPQLSFRTGMVHTSLCDSWSCVGEMGGGYWRLFEIQ